MEPKGSQLRIMDVTSEVYRTDESTTIAEAAELMQKRCVGCLLVTDDRQLLVGIVTERDLLVKVLARRRDPDRTLVGEVMTRRLVTCSVETSLADAQKAMAQHRVRHLPIVDGDAAIGMISSRDLLEHQLSAVEELARKQSKVLNKLEDLYPGITQVEMDPTGRIVI
jgi:CBS domain-containing protein